MVLLAITQEMINANFWPSFLTGIILVVKQPAFILLIILVITFNIIKAALRKKRKRRGKMNGSK